jgi:hypothetical protein
MGLYETGQHQNRLYSVFCGKIFFEKFFSEKAWQAWQAWQDDDFIKQFMPHFGTFATLMWERRAIF